jgi:hypothetical protein
VTKIVSCPKCQSVKINKSGTTKTGTPCLRCQDCGKRWATGGKKQGRPTIPLEERITAADRYKAWLKKKGLTSHEYLKMTLEKRGLTYAEYQKAYREKKKK